MIKQLTHSLLVIIFFFLLSCGSNENEIQSKETKTIPIVSETGPSAEEIRIKLRNDSIAVLKSKYEYAMLTFSSFIPGDEKRFVFATKDNYPKLFSRNESQFKLAKKLDKAMSNSHNLGWISHPEYIGKTFELFYETHQLDEKESDSLIIKALFLSDEPTRDVIVLKDEIDPKDPLTLMGDAEAILQDINGVFSKPMTAKQAFESLKSSGTLHLNNRRIEFTEPIEVSGLANFNIRGNGATLVAKVDMPIITFRKVMNIGIRDLNVIHEIGGHCAQNCIEFFTVSNLRINKCDFDGSGYFGLALTNAISVTLKNNRFHNCTYGIAAWNSRRITIKDNSFFNNREGNIMVNDPSQYSNDFRTENTFGELIDYSYVKEVEGYNCYVDNNNPNLVAWISYGHKGRATQVKYKGMEKAMDLVYVRTEFMCDRCAYPTVYDYYNEIYEGKINGTYKVTHAGSFDGLEYIRGADSKQFHFEIDPDSKPWSRAPCF